MKQSLVAAGIIALGILPVVTAQDPIAGVVKTIDVSDRSNPPPVAPVSVSAPLSEEVPAGVTVPANLNEPWCGMAKIGDRKLAVLVGKSTSGIDAPDVMYIDLDGDGKLVDVEQMVIETSTEEQRGTKITRSKAVEFELPSGVVFNATFMKAGERPPMTSLQFMRYLEATAPSGIVAVVDRDFDGTFGSAGDMWTMSQKGAQPAGEYGLMAMAEHVFRDGKLHAIKVADNSVTISSAAATAPDPKDAAAQRVRVEHIWSERFDAERAGFLEQRGLDTSRALAKKPIDWQYVTFEQAIALGKKANKPVFIDVMAFWCVWCYRMDYYTYPDAEVAKVLSEDYIPVKLIQEQDLAGDYDTLMKDKLKARGIPAMGVFNGNGDAVHTIGGWMKPEDFLKELETGKSKFAGN